MTPLAQDEPQLTERTHPAIQSESILDASELKSLLESDQEVMRDRMRQILSRPDFALKEFSSCEEHQAQVLEWGKTLARLGIGPQLVAEKYGGTNDLTSFIAAFEMLAYHSISLTIKFGVQYGLFASSVLQLGTERHHAEILPDAVSFKLPGCFAMTEIGHGSNVRGLETTATYQKDTDSFVIHSPQESAAKIYIGNAARDGRMATVFAQLVIDGTSYGVHAFLVPLRDDQHRELPGVRIEDCGEKIGLNGVDNGMIWFDHVSIPRTSLLDRFAQVNSEGEYTSEIENEGARFFTMLGTLVGGRMCIAGCATMASKVGLTIALRYAHRRRQFGSPGKSETLLIDYPTHQVRLLPALAKTYAMHAAIRELTRDHVSNNGKTPREIETRAAALKAYATWTNVETLQTCRECCGGEGYLSVNRFADLKADTDIFTTFEGDNTVLSQLAAKGLLTELKARFQSGELSPGKIVKNKLRTWFSRRAAAALNDRDFLIQTLRHREETILLNLAQRFRKLKKQGRDDEAILHACQTDLLTLSEAYSERLGLEALGRLSEKLCSSEVQHALHELHQLYALDCLHKHADWYLAQRYLRPREITKIREQRQTLCQTLTRKSLDLTEAFDIPSQCLRAPIAR